MVKEHCAAQNQNCPGKSVCPWPIATWDMVRQCMQDILTNSSRENLAVAGSLEALPLSNVKRLFRSRFQLELSETALGYSKLSELLKDTRVQDICTVELRGQGYMVVPRALHMGTMPAELVACYTLDAATDQSLGTHVPRHRRILRSPKLSVP